MNTCRGGKGLIKRTRRDFLQNNSFLSMVRAGRFRAHFETEICNV
jgi:hypothetical protein